MTISLQSVGIGGTRAISISSLFDGFIDPPSKYFQDVDSAAGQSRLIGVSSIPLSELENTIIISR